MRARGGGGLLFVIGVAALAAALLGAPGAGAATVINGDFESGDLQGWQVQRETGNGNWFAYKGTGEPIARERGKQLPQAPPQGRYAAISDQLLSESAILFQQISLAPGLSHRLSLLAYYDAAVPLATAGTLSVAEDQLGSQANQQFRVDVLRAGAPIASLDPADILATAFSTASGGPQTMGPTWVTADLSPFAGQAVTLRIASVANQELLTAGVDAIAVDSTQPGTKPPPLGSNQFAFGKLKLNRARGTATLAVQVPGPGRLTATGRKLKRFGIAAAKAGTVKLRLAPSPKGRAILGKKHKLRARVAVTFAPTGGEARTKTRAVTLKLAAPRHRP